MPNFQIMEEQVIAMTAGKSLPSLRGKPMRPADFDTVWAALDYAAECDTGFNFYSVRGELKSALSYSAQRGTATSIFGLCARRTHRFTG